MLSPRVFPSRTARSGITGCFVLRSRSARTTMTARKPPRGELPPRTT